MILLFVVGLTLLIVGAEALVRGASRISHRLGVSPLVIGLTVVAFGTSAPEVAVSIKAAVSEQPSIALGNVVGSNVFNVLFILGLSALVAPLVVKVQLVRLDVPLMIAVSVVTLLLAWDGGLQPIDGVILVVLLLAYLWFLAYLTRRDRRVREGTSDEFDPLRPKTTGWLGNLALIVGGLALLVLVSRWFVNAAVSIAEALNISELVIGLTIVAAGTSLPEVMTSVIAIGHAGTFEVSLS
ncbi:MAG: calcium/sodium antiporter [Rhodothermales bacterium]